MGHADDCPFGPDPHPRNPAHHHGYVPSDGLTRQCTCGSRTWKVSIRPGFPVQVVCARDNCHRVNRAATAYERGREAGPRVRAHAAASPPF